MVQRLLFCSVLPALGVVNLWWFSHFLELNDLERYLQIWCIALDCEADQAASRCSVSADSGGSSGTGMPSL
jgi:hypothetical protein